VSTRTLWARIRRVWAIAGLLATAVFAAWSLLAFRATSEAHAAMRSDARVVVAHGNGIVNFTSTAQKTQSPVGLVFFAGAMVDPVAYAPLMRAVAQAGFPAILVPLPRRGAFGGANSADVLHTALTAMQDDTRATRWLIGGHSKGAVVATRMVAELSLLGAGNISGLLLVATTHPRDVDLSRLKWPVTKVVGTNDGIAPITTVQANRALLPATTHWVRIEGGNHSQFGWYGFQPLDHVASISRQAQHEQLIQAVIDALRRSGEPISSTRAAGR
jgi:pimeloyl-ACP methyl ester carboxylesterase